MLNNFSTISPWLLKLIGYFAALSRWSWAFQNVKGQGHHFIRSTCEELYDHASSNCILVSRIEYISLYSIEVWRYAFLKKNHLVQSYVRIVSSTISVEKLMQKSPHLYFYPGLTVFIGIPEWVTKIMHFV